MDGSTADHSDSDSGESWTLLEHTATYEDIPVSPENQSNHQRELASNVEKDEDTDGISIISDSDPESSTPCELSYDYEKCLEENRPTEQYTPQYISLSQLQPNHSNHHESIRTNDDLLEDSNGKHKTYVHRRNKRLSTVLNIIMLGSVITAAGVAIGHMWGARNDCLLHTTPSVNKILSNLYKLQEENAYLRSKLRELTLSNIQLQHKPVSEKLLLKQQRCKKVYEESINNRNADKATKCLDNNVEHILSAPMIQPKYENDFLHDMDKLKHVYQQNKTLLDGEIDRRMKREVQFSKSIKNILKNTNLITVEEELIESKDEITKSQVNTTITKENIEREFEMIQNPFKDNNANKTKQNKISYADSLKTDHQTKKTRNENIHKVTDKGVIDLNIKKKKLYVRSEIIPEISLSEDELSKDDRYIGPKIKQQKKHDRQKSHKKQKRKNKYEQWEMKGGYQKDYDEFSMTSTQDNDYILKNPNKNTLNNENVLNNYMDQYDDKNVKKLHGHEFKNTSKDKHSKKEHNKEKDRYKNKDFNWYDKRTTLRSEARKKLEQELFGNTTQNTARWYFRRMQKREQCRAKGDNSTYRKLTKRNMNYKMKR